VIKLQRLESLGPAGWDDGAFWPIRRDRFRSRL